MDNCSPDLSSETTQSNDDSCQQANQPNNESQNDNENSLIDTEMTESQQSDQSNDKSTQNQIDMIAKLDATTDKSSNNSSDNVGGNRIDENLIDPSKQINHQKHHDHAYKQNISEQTNVIQVLDHELMPVNSDNSSDCKQIVENENNDDKENLVKQLNNLKTQTKCGPINCEHQRMVESMHAQLDRFLEEKDQLSQTVKELRSDLSECERLMADKDRRLNELKDSEQIICKLKALAIKLKRELAEVKENESKCKDELKNVIKETDKIQVSHHLLIKNFQSLQAEHDQLQDEYENAKKSLKLYESDLACNVYELTNKKGQIEVIRSENEQMQKKLVKLEQKLEQEHAKIKELDSRIIVLKNKLDDERKKNNRLIEIEKQNEQLTHKLNAKDIIENELKQKFEQMNDKCKRLNEQEQQVKRLENEIEKLTTNVDKWKTLHTDADRKLLDAEQLASKLQQKCDQLNKEMNELKQINNQLKCNLNDLQSKFSLELKSKNELVQLAEEELKCKEREFNAYKLKVNKVLNEKRNVIEQSNYEQQLLQAQNKLEDMAANVRSLQETLQQRQDKLEESERQADELRAQVENLKQNATDCNEMCRQIDRLKADQRENQCKLLEEKQLLINKLAEIEMGREQMRSDYEQRLNVLDKQLIELCQQNQYLQDERKQHSYLTSQSSMSESNNDFKINHMSTDSANHLNDSLDCDHASDNDTFEANSGDDTNAKTKRLSVSSLTSNLVNPLHEILNAKETNADENNEQMTQLRELFEESEANNSLLTEQNRVLKEEIRRLQRSIERTEIAENLEYLKNVLIKFVSIENNTNASEKKHLVPVLKTILKLSKEEESKLQNFASFLSNLNENSSNTLSTNQSNWSSYIWNGFN